MRICSLKISLLCFLATFEVCALFSELYCLHVLEYNSTEYYIWLSIHKRIFSCIVYLIFLSHSGNRYVCFKKCRGWTKRDTYELDKTGYSFLCPTYPLIYLLAYYISSQLTCFYPLSPQTTLRETCSKSPVVGQQINVRKKQEQPSTSSRDIVGVDQLRNLSGYSLRLNQTSTFSREKGLELLIINLNYHLLFLQSLFYLYLK